MKYQNNFYSNLFDYNIINNTNLNIDDVIIMIYNILERWEKIIDTTNENKIKLNIIIDYLDEISTLGYTRITNISSFIFGESKPNAGEIVINAHHLTNFNYNKTFYTFLHEFGHIMGIGNLWYLNNSPINTYSENGTPKKYYMGTNAVREYRRYFNNNNLIGIPVEDNGSEGTVNLHPEEGQLGSGFIELSTDNRYIEGIFHPGMRNELMTGWLTGNPSMSRITIGFLEDLGYKVNYQLSDYYNPLNITLPEYNIEYYLPDNEIYNRNEFYKLFGMKEKQYVDKKIKIMIIDTGFKKNIIEQQGVEFKYKNFITNNLFLSNDTNHGTFVFQTIRSFINSDFYFAEAEWVHDETISEVDYTIKALEWARTIKPDIVNFSFGYTLDDPTIEIRRKKIESIISEMKETIFISGIRKLKSDLVEIPGSIDLPNLITVGNSQGSHDFENSIKPDFVIPNLDEITGNIYWDKIQSSSKSTAVFTGLVGISMIERKNNPNFVIDKMISNAIDNRSVIYGFKYPNMKCMIKQKRNLKIKKGWNLISFPLEEINLSDLVQNSNIEIIKDEFQEYNKYLPFEFNTLQNINSRKSYWVRAINDTNLEFNGFLVGKCLITLKKGWNLFGCPVEKELNIKDIINKDVLEIKSVFESYRLELSDFSSLKKIKPNIGYYIKVLENTTILIK